MQVKFNVLKQEWEKFINGKHVNTNIIKPEILASWKRSKSYGISPFESFDIMLSDAELKERCEKNACLIKTAKPFMNLLYQLVEGSELAVFLVDKEGYILEMIGDMQTILNASKNKLLPGANRSEEKVGTNAIALSLVEDKPIQLVGPEHYNQNFHNWTCAASPIHNTSGEIIGVLNVSANYKLVHKHTLGMVVSVVKAIERELLLTETNKEIKLLNNLLSGIIESVSDGLIAFDNNGKILYFNSKISQFFAIENKKKLKEEVKKIIYSNKQLLNKILSKTPIYDKEFSLTIKNQKKHFVITVNPIVAVKEELLGTVVLFKEKSSVHKLVHKVVGAKANFEFDDIVGENPHFRNSIELAKKVAASNARVVLEGESGTGKELFAQAIHNASDRANGPFIAVNCSAIPRELIESELFGYEEGAFTGARKGGKPGKFELAEGGTLFLDEIGELPLEMQAKLLRVLQENQLVRIGGSGIIKLDVRVIAATNKNLSYLVKNGNFREDLYYRLSVITINIPPLRERKDDIPLLISHFCKNAERLYSSEPKVDDEALELMMNYDWPGNVRQLQNVIERAVILSQGKIITKKHLPMEIQLKKWDSDDLYFIKPIKEIEKQAIEAVIRYSENNLSKASKILEISRNTLYRKIKEYGIKYP
ncbi:MAG: sigma-54 dependent transcriptional regulator, acetoin dehydrogenase operon transcriptional [Thermosediminibacterales bacterium]|nr:sigma-54 dependent transcriptional regulator, acetoin dehydrogenase operon transcriptional [Thermosediminibacterales bacterium]